MESVFDQIEKVWLCEGRAKFVNDADEITLADLQLACELENVNMSG